MENSTADNKHAQMSQKIVIFQKHVNYISEVDEYHSQMELHQSPYNRLYSVLHQGHATHVRF
jgi:hypothetical protein